MSQPVQIAWLVTALALAPTPATAQPTDAGPATGPTDAAELEAFLDGVMAAHLDAFNIAGATVAVVEDGELLLAKGYGFADVETKRPVVAKETLFRLGSVSKLFVWTAVMQLVERDALDLDADVNRYVEGVEVPATFPQPITLRHLLAHTAGFEDRVIGIFARDREALRPLDVLLADELPTRVRPPGQLASYSNHGSALAALAVEHASGTDWNDYVETEILSPLNMRSTTFAQPPPPPLAERLSRGYRWRDGAFEERPFEFVPAAPIGSASATATDVAEFMIAHLRGGQGRGGRILSERTAQRMQGQLFSPGPELNAMLHGFWEMSRNGERIIGHGGDTFAFHALLALWPEHDLGLFVGYNSESGPRARESLLQAMADHYFPAAAKPVPVPTPEAAAAALRAAGAYRLLRRPETTIAKLAGLVFTLRATASEDGFLLLGYPGETPRRFIAVQRHRFQEVDGPEQIQVRTNTDGAITHLFLDRAPMLAFERLAALSSLEVQGGALVLFLIILLTAVVFWPAHALRHRRDPTPPVRLARVATLVSWSGCALGLAGMIGVIVLLREPMEIAFGVPPLLWLPLLILLLAAPAFLAAPVLAGYAWRRGFWWRGRRIHYTTVAVTGILFLAWLFHWNLLGFKLG